MTRVVFPLVNKEDFIYYLRDIIDITARYLIRYKRYLDELEELILKYNMRDDLKKKVSNRLYDDFYDRLRHVQTVLLNLIGDKSKQSLSYNKFREIADKRMANGLNLNLVKLPDEIRKELNRFNNWRNLNLHIPLTFLSITKDLAKQKVSEDPINYSHIPNNPILIAQYEHQYSELFIESWERGKEFYSLARKMHQQMKKDYSKLIDESIEIIIDRRNIMELEEHQYINDKMYELN